MSNGEDSVSTGGLAPDGSPSDGGRATHDWWKKAAAKAHLEWLEASEKAEAARHKFDTLNNAAAAFSSYLGWASAARDQGLDGVHSGDEAEKVDAG